MEWGGGGDEEDVGSWFLIWRWAEGDGEGVEGGGGGGRMYPASARCLNINESVFANFIILVCSHAVRKGCGLLQATRSLR